MREKKKEFIDLLSVAILLRVKRKEIPRKIFRAFNFSFDTSWLGE
jgi:hypothetical protein